MQGIQKPFPLTKYLTLILIAQAVLIPILVGVDVPYRDEWDSIIRGLVLRSQDGFHFSQLFLPVVEHRLPLPQALFQLLSQDRYYPKLFMLLSSFTHLVGWYFFTRSWFKDSCQKTEYKRLYFLAPIVLLLYFHWAQLMNYTMGVQLFWVLGPVATVAFICALLEKNLSLAIFSHLISILSFPTWPIHFGILGAYYLWQIAKNNFKPTTRFNLAIGTFVLLTGALTFGYLYKSAGVGLAASWPKVIQFAVFVIASPLSRYNQDLAWVFGPLFIVAWVYRMIRGPKYVSPEALYLFGVLTLLSSLLIGYGRYNYGLSYAFGGHYLLLTVPGWCVVMYEVMSHLTKESHFRIITSALMLYLVVLSGKSMREELTNRRPILLQARLCLMEGNERNPQCAKVMEEIFLNNYTEKYQLVKAARDSGVFP
ncbi:MAG: hypothetical protein EOP04_06030 [Proteobacteria bacterium]|nr:MAG: hypothetical protein EOP04_06030 [Pseudomonadota bacterium]